MKTTVDINDSLLEEVRRQANTEKTTVKALIEEGLRRILANRRQTLVLAAVPMWCKTGGLKVIHRTRVG